jgi:hypothetical protein
MGAAIGSTRLYCVGGHVASHAPELLVIVSQPTVGDVPEMATMLPGG